MNSTTSSKIVATVACFALFTPQIAGGMEFVTMWGAQGSDPGEFNFPTGIALSPNGEVYVSDGGNHRIQRFSSDGNLISTIGGLGSGPGFFNRPDDLKISPTNGDLYIADTNNHRVQRLASDGTFVLAWGSFGTNPGQFAAPWGIHVDSQGDVFVISRDQTRVQKFTETGVFLMQWGIPGTGFGQFQKPRAVATDGDGNIYVSDVTRHDIQKFSPFADYILQWGSPGSEPGQFLHPYSITFSRDHLVIVDWLEHPHGGRLTSFTQTGTISEVLVAGIQGTGPLEFNTIYAVAHNGTGTWYVAEWGNHRVQKLRETVVGAETVAPVSDAILELGPPYPHPAKAEVNFRLSFDSSPSQRFTFDVHNVLGERVHASALDIFSPGGMNFVWNGLDDRGASVPPGVYFLHVQGVGFDQTRKIVRVR